MTTAQESPFRAPAGLEGVVVADTEIGEVRGEAGFFHYRQYSAIELAHARCLEDVWFLLFYGHLPSRGEAARFLETVVALRALPAGTRAELGALTRLGGPLEVLRSAVSLLGAELGWRPTLDLDPTELRTQAVQLCALVPTVLAASWRLRHGEPVVEPRADLGATANLLWMTTGEDPVPAHARAVEQYQMLTVDHGFNASTFAARVITSTGADLASAVCGALGALSGPLHGGAPSRALAMLDEIGTVERAGPWVRAALQRGERLMGFGHRAYRTDDPRSIFLREVARSLGGPRAELTTEVEAIVLAALAQAKPGRPLRTNVEFYAGVVLEACGVAREMLTPTFAAARTIGWCAHVLEQAAHNRLIRPSSRYVGPPPPEPVPPR